MNLPRTPRYLGRGLVAVLAAVLVNCCPTYGQNGAVGVACPARGITVDGELSDWPAGLQSHPIGRIALGDRPGGEDDVKAPFRIAHDAGSRALDVAVEVRDDPVVLDGPGEAPWDGQDGCELDIDAAHACDGPPVVQYARYGNQDPVFGPGEDPEKSTKVALTRKDSRIVYEWRITARMVLTHRTGFPNWRTGKLDIRFTPGTRVSYSGEGFVSLGRVVAHLTGKSLVELCREEVFAPLGVESASLVWDEDVARRTATGHGRNSSLSKGKPDAPNVAASLHIDAGNHAKFLTTTLQGKGLSEPTFKEMLRSQVKDPDNKGFSRGLGLSIEEPPSGTNDEHGGSNPGFTSRSLRHKDQGIGYVILEDHEDRKTIDDVLNAYLIAGNSGLKATGAIGPEAIRASP
jgi:hypothetical protein